MSPAHAAVPIHVGGAAAEDACAAVGAVTIPRLAVRDGPGLRFRAVDRLNTARELRICEERPLWLGVVYGPGDCGVATPGPRRPYTGPCRYGWVFRRYIRLTAG